MVLSGVKGISKEETVRDFKQMSLTVFRFTL